MIHTRLSIYQTLVSRITALRKRAEYDPKEFKKILFAVILNDLKEWSEYIPTKDGSAIVAMLDEYLINNGFKIERLPVGQLDYVNVNTPQTNNTWARIWDRQNSVHETPQLVVVTPSCTPWEEDPSCETKIVYFYPIENETDIETLKQLYGEYGEKLKTVCEKMQIFVNRDTGRAYYLTTDCVWKELGGDENMSEEEIIQLIEGSKIKVSHAEEGQDYIQLDIKHNDEEADGQIQSLRDVEDLI